MKNYSKNPVEITMWAVVDSERTIVNIYKSTASYLKNVIMFFYQTTLWSNIILSRALYESLPTDSLFVHSSGRSSRHLHIISNDPEYEVYDPLGTTVVHRTVAAAIEYIQTAPIRNKNAMERTFIIDGGRGDEFFWATLQCCTPDIDRIVLIRLDKKVHGPRSFPWLNEDREWKKGDAKKFPRFPGSPNIFPHEQTVYENTNEKPLDL